MSSLWVSFIFYDIKILKKKIYILSVCNLYKYNVVPRQTIILKVKHVLFGGFFFKYLFISPTLLCIDIQQYSILIQEGLCMYISQACYTHLYKTTTLINSCIIYNFKWLFSASEMEHFH